MPTDGPRGSSKLRKKKSGHCSLTFASYKGGTHFLRPVDSTHPHLREMNTRQAQSWHRACQWAAGPLPNTGSGTVSLLQPSCHALQARSLQSVFCFLSQGGREAKKKKKTGRWSGGVWGRNWHWKTWAGPVQTKAGGLDFPFHVGEYVPVGMQQDQLRGLPQTPDPCARIQVEWL